MEILSDAVFRGGVDVKGEISLGGSISGKNDEKLSIGRIETTEFEILGNGKTFANIRIDAVKGIEIRGTSCQSLFINDNRVVTEPEIQNFPTIHRFRNPTIPAGCTSFAFVTLDGSEPASIEGKYFDVNGSYGGVSEFFFTNVLDSYVEGRGGIQVSMEIEQKDETPSGGGYSRKSFIGHIASQSSDISGGRYSLLVLG